MGKELASVVEGPCLEKRPGILFVGSPNVGKRTLLSRLIGINFEEVPDSSSDVLCYGWTINTKYYTADVAVSMAHLGDGFSFGTLPMVNKLAALVMVFDMSDLTSFTALQNWVAQNDIKKFDILLCIGNKADLLPGHFAHVGYKRLLLRHWESFSDPDNLEYGNLEGEGSSLLGDEEPSWELRRSCLEWCVEQKIEYVEACASNADFDKCLSVDGDSQGVERLYGALSAHMWPGMVLKSGNKIADPYALEEEELSEEESDYELEYEVLSPGSAEPWDDDTEEWVSADAATTSSDTRASGDSLNAADKSEEHETNDYAGGMKPPSTSESSLPEPETNDNAHGMQPSASETTVAEKSDAAMVAKDNKVDRAAGDTCLGFEDLEHLMNEIGNVRDNLRLMPDFQRREMAAKLAMKMASMFGASIDEEEFV